MRINPATKMASSEHLLALIAWALDMMTTRSEPIRRLQPKESPRGKGGRLMIGRLGESKRALGAGREDAPAKTKNEVNPSDHPIVWRRRNQYWLIMRFSA